MRLLLTTIILTMLAQPVCAYSVEYLVTYCSSWENRGYTKNFSSDKSGQDALACSGYMSAISDLGEQNCIWDSSPAYLKWDATAAQLAQFLLNRAKQKPEEWGYYGYSFLVVENISVFFPCKK